MKRENIRLLLITKIPLEEKAQGEVLDELHAAIFEARWEDVFVILRSSYMGEKDIMRRKEFYLRLVSSLEHAMCPGSPLGTGQAGLYIGFIAEDLSECPDAELKAAGKTLLRAQRLATNPPPFKLSGAGHRPMGTLPFQPVDAGKDPRRLVMLLLDKEGLFADPASHSLRDALIGGDATPEGQLSRAHALVLVGAQFEAATETPWALACYHAASVISPQFDLPWAFLAHYSENPDEGLGYAQKAVQANPRSLPGLHNRGALFARLGRYEEALRDFAEVCRFDQQNPRSLLMCAQAAFDAGDPIMAAKVFLAVANALPQLAEPWHGLARLCMVSGLLESARGYQNRCFRLSLGNVAASLRLGSRVLITGPKSGIGVFLGETMIGRTPLDVPELSPGEHRIRWEGGPSTKLMSDEGEGHHLFWTGNGDEVRFGAWEPRPAQFPDAEIPGHRILFSRRRELQDFLGKDPAHIPNIPGMGEILSEIAAPTSPFGGDGRLTVEFVFSALLEDILADGVLDQAENEILRAVRDRLLIDGGTFSKLMESARAKASQRGQGNPLDGGSLYRRLWKKAQEDGTIEDSERTLLQAVAEALLLLPQEIAAIERAEKS